MEAEDVVQIRKELQSIRKQVDHILDRLDCGLLHRTSTVGGEVKLTDEGNSSAIYLRLMMILIGHLCWGWSTV